ncbi:hypothetical protein GCM10010517_21450 [Streptosporangium fragile]|uniref:ASCH domain-containing protein n=1 Tax=Streptosporangium fragile TaxID=46186 RepID=A0ABP6IDS3_9ACTN
MLLTDAVARGVADGVITTVFRRWSRPNVRAGGTLRTSAGVLAIDAVEPVEPASVTDEDARAAGAASAAELFASLGGTAADTLFRIRVRWAGPDPRDALSEDADLDDAQVAEIRERLARMDRRRAEPWTHGMLRLIAARPGERAADLAAVLGRETAAVKLDVRKLKELGLTHSLTVGYRLSPRGEAYLARDADLR